MSERALSYLKLMEKYAAQGITEEIKNPVIYVSHSTVKELLTEFERLQKCEAQSIELENLAVQCAKTQAQAQDAQTRYIDMCKNVSKYSGAELTQAGFEQHSAAKEADKAYDTLVNYTRDKYPEKFF